MIFRTLLALILLTVPAGAFSWSAFNAEAASLSAMVEDLKRNCGAKVISGYRKTLKPNGQISCHATGQAVDMVGNYTCMYRRLSAWPGGFTTDAQRCRHIHISTCKSEWGLRFRHRVC